MEIISEDLLWNRHCFYLHTSRVVRRISNCIGWVAEEILRHRLEFKNFSWELILGNTGLRMSETGPKGNPWIIKTVTTGQNRSSTLLGSSGRQRRPCLRPPHARKHFKSPKILTCWHQGTLEGWQSPWALTHGDQVPEVLQHHVRVSFLWAKSSSPSSSLVKVTVTSLKDCLLQHQTHVASILWSVECGG